jgi:hypothetical protein
MDRAIDLTGQRFGRLIALHRVENVKPARACWRCQCVCGTEIETLSWSLRSGETKSCGCLAREIARLTQRNAAAANIRHGHTRGGIISKEYEAWRHVTARYGDIPLRWQRFEAFLADVGPRPSRARLKREGLSFRWT